MIVPASRSRQRRTNLVWAKPILGLFLALGFQPQLLLAQTPGNGDGLFDSDWATPKMSEAELFTKMDATLLLLGAPKAWTEPDPSFASSAAWRDAVIAAPPRAARELLSPTNSWRVELRWTESAKQLLGTTADGVWRDIVELLNRYDIRTSPQGKLQLTLTLDAGTGTARLLRRSSNPEERPIALLTTEARLALPARVRRGEEVFLVECALGSYLHAQALPGTLTRRRLLDGLEVTLTGLLQQLNAAPPPATTANPWADWLAASNQADSRYATFTRAYRPTPSSGDDALARVTGFSAVRILERGWEQLPATRFFASDEFHRLWLNRMAGASIPAATPAGPILENQIHLAISGHYGDSLVGALWASRVATRETDALACLGNRYIRINGETWTRYTRGTCLPSEVLSSVRKGTRDSADWFSRSLGQGGARPGQSRHPDADAVANFLRQRQLVEIPPEALEAIANRIAFALAPPAQGWPDRDWIETVNGQRIINLGRAGYAQGRSTAVRQKIEVLTLADPIGLWAFDNLWQLDPNPPRYRPVLPEAFGKRFTRERPAGGGALAAVRVVSLDELAWKRTRRVSATATRNRIDAAYRELAQGLGTESVLECDYLPENRSMAERLTRYFWYRKAPPAWPALRLKFPPELQFDQIGPALEDGPDYLQLADERIGASK